jgi:hypothetical protein
MTAYDCRGHSGNGYVAMKKLFAILFALLLCIGLAVNRAESKPRPKPKTKAKQTLAKPWVSRSGSVEVKLGIAMMYDWWYPGFMKLECGLAGNVLSRNRKTIYEGSFMMGPTLWLKIGGAWNIGATGLFGISRNKIKHSTVALEANYLYLTIPSSLMDMYIDDGTSRIRRYEADFFVERFMYKFITLIFGARFNYNDVEGRSWQFLYLNPFPINKIKDDSDAWYVGPSLGAGLHYEIKGFSIHAGASALFQFGVYSFERTLQNPLVRMFNFISDETKIAYVAMGADTFLKLAYFIEQIRVEFWVGGRYMILPHISVYDIGSAFNAVYKKSWITGEYEQLAGLTFGAMYKF